MLLTMFTTVEQVLYNVKDDIIFYYVFLVGERIDATMEIPTVILPRRRNWCHRYGKRRVYPRNRVKHVGGHLTLFFIFTCLVLTEQLLMKRQINYRGCNISFQRMPYSYNYIIKLKYVTIM